MEEALVITAALLTLVLAAPAQNGAAPAPIIDNERVTVWDVTWSSAAPPTDERGQSDTVWIYLSPSPGQVVYRKAGDRTTPAPGHAIVIRVKNHPVAPLKNASGYPIAFPREGNIKRFENDRIVIWDYTWTRNKPTPMHFHDKDVVVVYLKDGDVSSTTPDGKKIVNHVSTGMTRFNARDRVHSEELLSGESRAIITELK